MALSSASFSFASGFSDRHRSSASAVSGSVFLQRVVFWDLPELCFRSSSPTKRFGLQAKALSGGNGQAVERDSALVICFGEMLVDFVPTTSGLPLAEALAFKKAPGGAPANVAVGKARLGGSSAFIGKEFSGRVKGLKVEAVDTTGAGDAFVAGIPSQLAVDPSLIQVMASTGKSAPLKIMISGAPASGKGTQCELITEKYGLVHIAAGDLLRAEIASGSKNGKLAKEYMEKGQLVPNEIVVMMVKERLSQPDSLEKGWLLDGYPRSLSQATALKGFQPDIFILLEVSEELLVERVIGRRLDPDTGKIYHLKYSPPENEEIAARLTQRFDDTEEKVKLRLSTHHQNVEAVLSMYEDIIVKINGDVSKDEVFAQIDTAISKLLEQKSAAERHHKF